MRFNGVQTRVGFGVFGDKTYYSDGIIESLDEIRVQT